MLKTEEEYKVYVSAMSNKQLLNEYAEVHYNFHFYIEKYYRDKCEEELKKRLTLIGFLEK